jgi:hypothetical protein
VTHACVEEERKIVGKKGKKKVREDVVVKRRERKAKVEKGRAQKKADKKNA